jgi:3-oxoacyl-[acyl-carrier protein] reductase
VTADVLVQTALQAFGRLDGALISVGGPPPGTVMDLDDQQWRSSFEAVLLGAIRIARTVGRAVEDHAKQLSGGGPPMALPFDHDGGKLINI